MIPSWGLWGFEQPALLLAIRIELGERGETAAHSRKDRGIVQVGRVGNRLGHDPPTAIRKLVETPKLFWASRIGRQNNKFPISCSGQCPLSPGNGDFEIARAEVAAPVFDRLNRPLLLCLTH